MSVATFERCRRCATKLRNNRKICPCCGFDPAHPDGDVDQPSSNQPRRVAAKAGVAICPVCMQTSPEEQMVEVDGGQKLCPACAEGMKNKAMKKQSGGPPR